MGGLFFSIQKDASNINIQFTKSFMKMQPRGTGYTQYVIDHTKDLNLPINIWMKNRLSKYDLLKYKLMYFIYGYHRSTINDDSLNGSQPFVDPIQHMIHKYTDLATRPLRKLMCNGEIYNYTELKESNGFTEKNLSSNSDVEVILPLYIKNGIEETLEDLNGEFAFVLTQNTDTYLVDEIEIFAARDFLGIKPLYYTKDSDDKIIMFVSQKNAVPECYKDYEFLEFPIGSYWSYKTNTFTKFFDFHDYLDLDYTITTADPDSLETVYNNISTKLEASIQMRLHDSIGVFVSDGFDSSILVSLLCKLEVPIINVLSFGSQTADTCIDFLKNIYPGITFNHYCVSEEFNISSSTIEEIKSHIDCHMNVPTAIGIYSLMKITKKHNIKVMLCGEGLNSMFPSKNVSELQVLSVQLLEDLHKHSLLLWDRIAGMFDIEVRFPWLDKDIIDFILKIKPNLRLPQIFNNQSIPKYIIKKSFDGSGLLPSETLWKLPESFNINIHEF